MTLGAFELTSEALVGHPSRAAPRIGVPATSLSLLLGGGGREDQGLGTGGKSRCNPLDLALPWGILVRGVGPIPMKRRQT